MNNQVCLCVCVVGSQRSHIAQGVQALPTRQYLDQTVVPVLLEGLAVLSKERCVFCSCC
jgi:hypothetical protein